MNWAFLIMWLFVVVVSVHDGYLALIYRPTLPSLEVNPFGRWLIDANDGGVALLLLVKGLGTFCAAALLLLLYWARPRRGWIVCAATALFQLALLLFLYLT